MKELPLPEYIKFDFLLVLLGTGIIAAIFYLVFFREIFSLGRGPEIIFLSFLILLMFFGFIMFIMGFYEMAQNYDRETRINQIKFKLQEMELRLRIKNLKKETESPK